MTTVLDEKRLQKVSGCFPKGIQIAGPPILLDTKLFPAVVGGFDTLTVTPTARFFPSNCSLYNVSGFTREQLGEQFKQRDFRHLRSEVSSLCFLQSLVWIHSGEYAEPIDFKRIVGYTWDGDALVAESVEGGFRQVPYPGDKTPWDDGTLAVFHFEEL